MANCLTAIVSEVSPDNHDDSKAYIGYEPTTQEHSALTTTNDDLDRNVYCLQGVPIDAIDMQATISRLLAAMEPRTPFLLSTPNLNFLVSSNTNPEFRESLWCSDLCPPDGVSIVWIARLLGVPIQERVAGSDIFESFVKGKKYPNVVSVFFFGGAEGIAASAAGALNSYSAGVRCVGWLNPGFGTIDEMSQPHIIDQINASGAQLLVVALGASKGQAWLRHNHQKLNIPVRSHLGAAIGFQAGVLKRAPFLVRRFGLEWLWRIKEEPYLWKRYAKDGSALVALLLSKVAPLALLRIISFISSKGSDDSSCRINEARINEGKISVSGRACAYAIPKLKAKFREAINSANHIDIDLSNLHYIDSRALGLLLMTRKHVTSKNGTFRISAVSVRARLLFWLNGVDDLLDPSAVRTNTFFQEASLVPPPQLHTESSHMIIAVDH